MNALVKRTKSSQHLGTHGVAKSGTVPGVMDPRNGRPSGWKSLAINLATMVYVSNHSFPDKYADLAQLFWISYKDLLKKYQHFDRTRLFGPEWTITQQWTTLNVPWSADYHTTKFMMEVNTSGPVVIVLSQVRLAPFTPAPVQWLTDTA